MKESRSVKILHFIEEKGNKLPSPATMFFYLSVIVIIISAIASYFDLSATYSVLNDGVSEEITVHATNLLSAEGWNFMTTNLVYNFKEFYALGVVITIMIMIGVAQGSGLLDVIVYKLSEVTPKSLVTPVVAFIGVMLSVASSTGYVVLVPLAAILFMSANRHPIAGVAVAFAGTSAGWGANLLIAANDPILSSITQDAAQTFDSSYTVDATANWYAAAVSVVLIVTVITLIDKFIVSPSLGEYSSGDEVVKIETITPLQKRGLKFAGISVLIYVVTIVSLIISGLNGYFGSFLLNPETNSLIGSPLLSGIIAYMGLLFIIPGIFYGIGAKTITSEKDVIKMMNETVKGLAPFIVIIFFAAQFTAFFTYTNLGTILAVKGAELLSSIGLTGLPLLIIFVLVVGALNLFMAVDSAKWAIIAPVFVPMFMALGFSPELTQMFYRVGDSSTNIIAPLMPFFPLVLSFMQRYNKKAGIGTLVSTMLPYSIGIMIVWTVFMIIWYVFGIPLGPGAALVY